MTLKDKLEADAKKLKATGKMNYQFHYALTVLAIFSSFVASLSVALDWFSRDVLAVIAAIPAAVLAAADRLNFEAKTKWYYGKCSALRLIAGAMEYENLSDAEAHRRLAATDYEFESRWPGIGTTPK